MELNKIYQGESLEVLKTFPDRCIDMVMTSPPYWALRDYGTASWEGGDKDCNHEVQDNIKVNDGDWERPSRKEFNKVGTLLKCQVCYKEFKGKLGTKFCSTKCLNTLSNEERTKATSELINTCPKCGAKKVDKQLGLEPTFQEYIDKLCNIFDEVKRVIKDEGTCFVNLGDTYNAGGNYRGKELDETNKEVYRRKDFEGCQNDKKAQGISEKCLCQIPARFSIEMCNRGWILRNTIIWKKNNCMPCSVKDRFTVDFEYIFFFSKQKKYYFEQQLEPFIGNSKDKERQSRKGSENQKYALLHGNKPSSGGRNKRCVWTINPKPFSEAHFAVYPEELCVTPIKAGCPEGGVVLDPFFGSGTTGLVALKNSRKFIGIELNEEYIKIADKRLKPWINQENLNKWN